MTADVLDHPAVIASGLLDRCDVIPLTKELDEEAWLTARRGGIGSSDAGAILGLSPYTSAYKVWANKLGFIPDEDLSDNDAVWFGTQAEPMIAERFAQRTGWEVLDPQCMFVLRSAPTLRCSPDRLYVTDQGELGIAELKTADQRLSVDWENDLAPPWYQAQIAEQAAVLGLRHLRIPVLIGGNQLRIMEVNLSPGWIEDLADHLLSWWGTYVETGLEPPIDGSDSTTEALNAIYKAEEDAEIEVGPEGLEMSINYLEAHSRFKAAEADKKLWANRMRALLGTNSIGTHRGTKVISNKESNPSRLDISEHAFREPDCHARFMTSSPTRTMLVSTAKPAVQLREAFMAKQAADAEAALLAAAEEAARG